MARSAAVPDKSVRHRVRTGLAVVRARIVIVAVSVAGAGRIFTAHRRTPLTFGLLQFPGFVWHDIPGLLDGPFATPRIDEVLFHVSQATSRFLVAVTMIARARAAHSLRFGFAVSHDGFPHAMNERNLSAVLVWLRNSHAGWLMRE
jgi:hypothetical protein